MSQDNKPSTPRSGYAGSIFSNTKNLEMKSSPLSKNPSSVQTIMNKTLMTSSPGSTRRSVNTVASDDEDIIVSKASGDSSITIPSMVDPHPLVKGRLTDKKKPIVSITPEDVIELKSVMNEYTTQIKHDFNTIMSKLNGLEKSIAIMKDDMQVFKKSTARFTSSGPAHEVAKDFMPDY